MATPTETAAETEHETAAGFEPYRLTVDRVERMAESGAFEGGGPVFLWKGQLVRPMTKGNRHVFSTTALTTLMVRLLPAGWHVRADQPVELNEDTLPEPDLAVARGTPRDYLGRRVRPADLGLVVEVADSSLGMDTGEVLRSYAREGVRVYWVINVRHGRVEVYSRPSGMAFLDRKVYGPGEAVPVVLDGLEVGAVAVDEMLP